MENESRKDPKSAFDEEAHVESLTGKAEAPNNAVVNNKLNGIEEEEAPVESSESKALAGAVGYKLNKDDRDDERPLKLSDKAGEVLKVVDKNRYVDDY